MARRIPLTVVATIDPVLRDSLVFGLVTDLTRTVVVAHDIVEGDGGGAIRRVVTDGTGVVEDVLVPLEHACVSCAIRQDALPTLRRLAADGGWDAMALALPVTAEPLPAARAVAEATRRGGELTQLRLMSVVGAVDLGTCVDDLLGDDLLEERGLSLTPDDRRAVGEALAAQLGHVDVLLTTGDRSRLPVASDLVDHLRPAGGTRTDDLHAVDLASLLQVPHDPRSGEARVDPLRARPVDGPTGHGVWTLDLRSERPFHPERLLEGVGGLGVRGARGRGAFWVANRPDSACGWDAAGGQLSIGELGPWGRDRAFTRLVVTGVGPGRADLRQAFEAVLLTEREMQAGLGVWLDREDVLEPWLGARSAGW